MVRCGLIVLDAIDIQELFRGIRGNHEFTNIPASEWTEIFSCETAIIARLNAKLWR